MPVAAARTVGPSLYSPTKYSTLKDVKEQNGLEVPRQLQWAKWHAGGEFVKVLCVKNVSTDVIKFTYKLLPAGSAFSVEYPEPRRLSPGMSATIRVAFRPSTRQTHVDELELITGFSSIMVPLSAVLPASKLQLPTEIDFGCVPVRQSCMQQLPIRNVGDAGLQFSWKLQEPFAVVPASGQLAPGQTLVCEVHFQPQEAAAFRVAAACSLDNGELLTVQVSGMAKFPFLSLESDCVDMGDVVVGQTAEAFVRFGNHSPVPANFFLAAGPGSHDGAISVQPMRGSLQPNEYSMLRVAFTPRATGVFSCETFTLVTEGGNKLALTCKGTAVAPQLRLSTRVFAFGSVRSGSTPSKTLYLENDSDLPVQYQFLTEPGGVFTLTRPHGIIRPRSVAHTGVKFAGTAPANYWQRIVCLVKDGEPQAVDALASCYDDTSRPPLLCYKHIQAHLSRIAAGQGQVPDTQAMDSSMLGQQQQQQQQAAADGTYGSNSSSAGSGGLGSGPQRDLAFSTGSAGATSSSALLQYGSSGSSGGGSYGPDPPGSASLTQQQQQQLAGSDSWQVLFDGLEAVQPAVTVSQTLLDFECCSRLSPAEPQSFQVTNCTNAKVVVSLVVPSWSDPLSSGPGNKQQIFTAFPESLELRPQATGTFRLAFRPPRDGQYYCQTVMLLSSVKAMRSFRLVQDQQVVPPWTCVLLACGNTFATLNPELSPKVSLSANSISFPPCHPGEAVHQTLCLTNHGDTPVHFAFTARAGTANHHGAAAAASRLSAATAIAAGAGTNADSGGSSRSSAGAKAGLVAAGGAWFGQFAVLPVQGVLEPKSQQLVALRFLPTDLNPAELKLSCIFNHSATNSASVLLSGVASEPRLVWDVPDNRLFFRPTCVGASSQRQLTVRNASKVPVGWQWVLSKKLQDAVSVAPAGGLLRGYEGVKVTVDFSPMKQGLYSARAALLLLPTGTAAASFATQLALPAAADSAAAGARPAAASLVHVTPTALEYGAAAAADVDAAEEQQQDGATGTSSSGASSGRLACEKLIMTIVGEATQGALSIEPASLAFGDINVGYPQRKALKLINNSPGVLRYHVTVVDENPEGLDCSEVACEFGSASAVLSESMSGAAGNGVSTAGTAGSVAAAAGGAADCTLDAPEGLVNARACKTLMLTLLPRWRGQYRLRLNLHAASMPLPRGPGSHRSLSAGSTCSSPGATYSTGRISSESPLKQHGGSLAGSLTASPANSPSPRGTSMLLSRHAKSAGSAVRSSLGAVRLDADGKGSGSPRDASVAEALDAIRALRGIKALTQNSGAGSAGAPGGREDNMAAMGDCGSSGYDVGLGQAALLDRPPLATAPVTANASFPSLLFTDVFCEGLPKQVSWQVLGLSQLNAELRCPVTAAEVQAQQLADKRQLSNDNAASLLPPFQLDLGVAAAGSGARQFWVEVTNDGVLPVDWELHSYDAPQVDLEKWVEPARPLSEAEKDRAFIIDNHIFEVQPKHGCLPAGQAQQVCIRFNPVAEGAYCLPLFLRIKDGKQLQLQLSAQAVAPTAQLALAVRGSHSCQLTAAPIGELQPPLQQYTLRNAGPAPLQYRLDTSPLQELARQNYSAEIIKYAGGSPLSGEVPAGDVAVFNWLFQPLEAKDYRVALPLSLGGRPPEPLLIHGRGYHPTQHPQHAAPTPDEAAQHWQGWLGFSQHPASTAHAQRRSSSADSGRQADAGTSSSSASSSGRWLLSSPEVLDLGVCLPAGSTKQLLTLTNTADVPMEFAWQYGVFEEQRAVMSGRLSIVPTTGVLEPGEARVCQVSFQAGLQPQLFSGEIYCHAAEAQCSMQQEGQAAVDAAGFWTQGLTLEQWQMLGSGGAAADEDEEIIAEDPPRQRLPPVGKILRERMPLHLSMTQPACNRFDTLRQRYQQALTLRTAHNSSLLGNQQQQQQWVQAAPQLLTVTVQGAVLCKAHINIGSYIRPQELQRARQLLAVAHLLPTVEQPTSLLPPPGALGPSAAAAKAVRAMQEQQQQQQEQLEEEAEQELQDGDSDPAAATAAAIDAAAEEPPGSAQLQAIGMAGAVLEEILTDAWADEDVISAFDKLQPAAAPTYPQLCKQTVQQGRLSGQQQVPASADVAQTVALHEALQQQDFHAFAEYVLDNALMGTLQEEGVAAQEVQDEC